MKNLNLILLWAAMGLSFAATAQQTPAPVQSERILVLGGTAHLGTGSKIEGAAIGFENGIITLITSESNVKASDWDQVIDAKGKHVYPGFIAPNSTLGLQEIGAVRATRDQYEVGTFKPNVRTLIAFNTDSEIPPTVRTNGVLMGQITPRGGRISGTSSVVHFDGWNWEDAVVRADDGIHLNWPSMYHVHSDKGQRNIAKRKTYDQQKREIEDFFGRAKAYLTQESGLTDVKMEAMKGLFDASATLYVHANDAKQISEAVHFKKAWGIGKMVIVGGYDSHLVADLLRDNEVGVMLRRVHQVPRHTDDDVDLPYKLPKLLQDEGVTFCLENAGDMEQMGTRNLPFYAGTAKAYGLTYEQAVRSISLSAAVLLGIDDMYGSLEVGKSATLFISEGDALDMIGNNVVHAYIDGRSIDLDNRQKQLYRKFKAKYDAQKAVETK